MLLLGLHPVEDAAAARRGADGRRRAPGAAEAVTGTSTSRRHSPGVTTWSRATTTRARSSGRRRRDRPHPRGGPHRRARQDRGRRRDATPADDIVIATGSDPVIPPVDGLRELEGVWTNREVTGLKPSSRTGCWCSAAGRWASRWRRRCARMGTSVALVEGSEHLLPREPRPLGEALGKALASEGIELHFGQHASRGRVARARTTCSSSPTARS